MTDQTSLRRDFLEGMSRAAASVCVVTTDGPAGRAGVTVTAMTSISADGETPRMLACVNASAAAMPAILANGCFCINVLSSGQDAISDIFSSRAPAPGGDKFNAIRVEAMPSGAPRILGALVSFDCRLISADLHGTHHLCIGAVGKVAAAPTGSPLLYGMRSYLRAEKQDGGP